LLVALGEFGAGLAILVGFRCRLAAVVVLAITAGTLAGWQGWNTFRLPLRTLEPTILVFLLGLALLFLGAGELSFDSQAGGKLAGGRPARKKG
jgi:uncharacterized membrane protein YphA (DoxX/SURF4 family)